MRRGSRSIVRSAVVLATVAFALGVAVVPALGDTLTVETFTGPSVSDPSAWVAGGFGASFPDDWPGKACLSGGADIAQAPIPGCANPSKDPAGSGVLRVTTRQGNQGFALYQKALPTSGGIDISFNQAQWGDPQVAQGDGLAFFLVDGSTNLTQPGGGGGNLGYSPGNNGASNGVANGLIGVGIDSWGNYSTALTVAPGQCTAPAGTPGSGGTAFAPDRVVVRGPGNGMQGYCWLGASAQLPEISAGSRAAATKLVRIVVDPDTVATRNVTVYLDGVQVVQVPVPPELIAATTFKFGFSGSIGAANDYHEIWNLNIVSVNPIAPVDVPAPPIVVAPRFTG